MPDISPGQVSLDQAMVRPPEKDVGSVHVIITRGCNAYMVQVVLKQMANPACWSARKLPATPWQRSSRECLRLRTVCPGIGWR